MNAPSELDGQVAFNQFVMFRWGATPQYDCFNIEGAHGYSPNFPVAQGPVAICEPPHHSNDVVAIAEQSPNRFYVEDRPPPQSPGGGNSLHAPPPGFTPRACEDFKPQRNGVNAEVCSDDGLVRIVLKYDSNAILPAGAITAVEICWKQAWTTFLVSTCNQNSHVHQTGPGANNNIVSGIQHFFQIPSGRRQLIQVYRHVDTDHPDHPSGITQKRSQVINRFYRVD